MLERLREWLRSRQARFSYVAHAYLKNVWCCTLCEALVHCEALEFHARKSHGFRGHIELTPHALKPGVSYLSVAEMNDVASKLSRMRGTFK